jgi:hypothetical protein
VRPRNQLPIALTQLAEAQAGIVTREQLRLLDVPDGVTERLLRDGWWRSVARGVYHTAPSDPTWSGLAWAGVLLGGDYFHAQAGVAARAAVQQCRDALAGFEAAALAAEFGEGETDTRRNSAVGLTIVEDAP